jgi:DnaJ like chaperone protein
MSILGAILGGAAGFAIGGPIGAIVGAAAGHAAHRIGQSEAGIGDDCIAPADEATRKATFTIGVIVLGAKMAKADGRVTPDEIQAFKRVFKTPLEEEKNVARLFNQAKKDTAGFEAYARQLARILEGSPEVKEEVVDCLFEIALADGEVHPDELIFLAEVARLMGLSEGDFARIRAIHAGPDGSDPYTILGIDREEVPDVIKARYRQLARDNHPDKLMAEGLPDEAIEVANKKFARINAAYDLVAKARGIR